MTDKPMTFEEVKSLRRALDGDQREHGFSIYTQNSILSEVERLQADLESALAGQAAIVREVEAEIGLYAAKYMQSRTARVEIAAEILAHLKKTALASKPANEALERIIADRVTKALAEAGR